MKKAKEILSAGMAIVILLSATGCHKKVKKVDPDDVTDALEDVLDFEENESISDPIENNYYQVLEDHDEMEIAISGCAERGTGIDNIIVVYKICYDEDDAEDEFKSHYDLQYDFVRDRRDYFEIQDGYYKEGEYGYLYYQSESDFFAYYYVDDMFLTVSASSEEYIEEAKDFIRELGLPVK